MRFSDQDVYFFAFCLIHPFQTHARTHHKSIVLGSQTDFNSHPQLHSSSGDRKLGTLFCHARDAATGYTILVSSRNPRFRLRSISCTYW